MSDETRLMAFSKRLKELRTARGITQFELAERMGTTESAVSRTESGKYNPSLLTLLKTAEALGIELSELVKGIK